jgi:MEMO1 family protein
MCYNVLEKSLWGSSSAGRASRSQRGGRGFESHLLHHNGYIPGTSKTVPDFSGCFMNKLTLFAVFLAIFLLFLPQARSKEKYADLSGTWYRSSSAALQRELSEYLDKARIPEIQGTVVSLVVPHAGFAFSGEVAACAFKLLKKTNPETVVIVGFTHMRYFPGSVGVFDGEAFVTPLGRAETEKEISKKLISFHPSIKVIPEAFENENSVEMLVPLAQTALPGVKFVFVSVGDQSSGTADILAEALYQIITSYEGVVLVASTDMCHFLGQKEVVAKDALTVKKMAELDPDAFYSYSLSLEHSAMCGYGVVYAVMKASINAGADEFQVLKYRTSGDVSGDTSRVVGYLSAAFVRTAEDIPLEKSLNKERGMFNTEERKKLLGLARSSIEMYLREGKTPKINLEGGYLGAHLGGFVTLRRNGDLRGCIGRMESLGPFYRTVTEMAVAAAVNDPRFSPVTLDELASLDIEISALSPMKKVTDASAIKMGTHGVMIKKGARSGVYLPQVATETGWSREEFLDSLCEHKAGISAASWRNGDAEIYVFTAEVFGEKEIDPSF